MPSCVILDIGAARLMRAVGATVERVIGLDAVPDDLAAAVGTHGREFVDRALEAVERMMYALTGFSAARRGLNFIYQGKCTNCTLPKGACLCYARRQNSQLLCAVRN